MVYAITAYINNTNMFISIRYHLALSATSGSYKSAGLPNIWGKISFYGNRGGVQKQEGAFLPDDTLANQVPALNESNSLKSVDRTITFYASRSSSIYGNSTTVQPNSYTVRKIIKY